MIILTSKNNTTKTITILFPVCGSLESFTTDESTGLSDVSGVPRSLRYPGAYDYP